MLSDRPVESPFSIVPFVEQEKEKVVRRSRPLYAWSDLDILTVDRPQQVKACRTITSSDDPPPRSNRPSLHQRASSSCARRSSYSSTTPTRRRTWAKGPPILTRCTTPRDRPESGVVPRRGLDHEPGPLRTQRNEARPGRPDAPAGRPPATHRDHGGLQPPCARAPRFRGSKRVSFDRSVRRRLSPVTARVDPGCLDRYPPHPTLRACRRTPSLSRGRTALRRSCRPPARAGVERPASDFQRGTKRRDRSRSSSRKPSSSVTRRCCLWLFPEPSPRHSTFPQPADCPPADSLGQHKDKKFLKSTSPRRPASH